MFDGLVLLCLDILVWMIFGDWWMLIWMLVDVWMCTRSWLGCLEIVRMCSRKLVNLDMTIGIYLEIVWMLIWLFDLQYFGFGNVFGISVFKICIKKQVIRHHLLQSNRF